MKERPGQERDMVSDLLNELGHRHVPGGCVVCLAAEVERLRKCMITARGILDNPPSGIAHAEALNAIEVLNAGLAGLSQ